MDTVTKKKRSEIMSKIRSVSKMEIRARKYAEMRSGCRLNHQPKGIVGKPDYANKGRRIAVFIQGCFFHQPCPDRCSKIPKSNTEFWRKKFIRNAVRHAEVSETLRLDGWRVITIWEHEVKRGERA